ncbi:MAG: YfcE family phosphodiesterase [Clostridia bacterium]|nr:YfcE family phosphodiesterase [Clostridia bacterium]
MSDSHNDREMLKRIVAEHRNNASLFVFLGDGIDEFEDITQFDSKIKSMVVKGNMDFDSYADEYELFDFAGKKIFATHGNLYSVKDDLSKLKRTAVEKVADICLYGHTHIQHHETDGELLVINPGAVSGAGNYCVVDVVDGGVHFEMF